MTDPKTYLKISLVNLSFVVVGFFAGVAFMERRTTTVVHAQEKFEEVAPIMTVGSAAIGTLLTNRIATDELQSHGYDLLKLQEGIVNSLASKSVFFTPAEIKNLLAQASVAKPLRMKAPAPAPQPKEQQKK